MNKVENEAEGNDAPGKMDEAHRARGDEVAEADSGENREDFAKDGELEADASSEQDDTSQADNDDDNEEADLRQLSSQELIEKLDQANQRINEMQDGFLRAKADVENIRRRSQNEIVSARKFAIEGFAQELLSVKDSLDQAAKVELDESQGEAVTRMKEGLELTLKQFDTVLGKFSVTEVEAAPGVKFNPEIHQAISMIPGGEVEPEHIVDVMQKGFMLKDRLLRPAMVVVAQSN